MAIVFNDAGVVQSKPKTLPQSWQAVLVKYEKLDLPGRHKVLDECLNKFDGEEIPFKLRDDLGTGPLRDRVLKVPACPLIPPRLDELYRLGFRAAQPLLDLHRKYKATTLRFVLIDEWLHPVGEGTLDIAGRGAQWLGYLAVCFCDQFNVMLCGTPPKEALGNEIKGTDPLIPLCMGANENE